MESYSSSPRLLYSKKTKANFLFQEKVQDTRKIIVRVCQISINKEEAQVQNQMWISRYFNKF